MRILYIFPHPDDESFGPARAIASQVRSGFPVFLLTLTRGGATKQRLKLDYTVEQMGEARYAEMQCVAEVLGLTDLTVHDLPDGGLKELDPREIEDIVRRHIERIRPAIVITYPVHGISGFHDHIVTHAVIKRVFLEMRSAGADYLRRLAFFTLTEEQAAASSGVHSLAGSTAEEIDCLVKATDEDMDAFRRALDCYVTYKDVIEQTGVRESLDRVSAFEIFGESHDPPLDCLTAEL